MAETAPASVAPARSSGPHLEARRVSVAYGSRRALDAIDFEVRAGEVVGLLGPNGAGKSTLVRALSGVIPLAGGEVRVLGQELGTLLRRELARRVAVVPQEPRFDFSFSALEIVLMGRHPHLGGLAFESDRDVALARNALARCGALHLAGRPIDQLSSGERQRIVFARALAQETPILLLDEPASFLDLRFQVELFDRVRELAEEGSAVVAVLHDLNLAAEYCDRVVLLQAGRVFAAGPTAEVLTFQNLTAVYETEIYVDVNDITGGLVVTPLSSRARRRLQESRQTEAASQAPVDETRAAGPPSGLRAP
ncbi:MAG: heme ABC transporter ATP-binding protein [Thermoanaerobaculia bacterium]